MYRRVDQYRGSVGLKMLLLLPLGPSSLGSGVKIATAHNRIVPAALRIGERVDRYYPHRPVVRVVPRSRRPAAGKEVRDRPLGINRSHRVMTTRNMKAGNFMTHFFDDCPDKLLFYPLPIRYRRLLAAAPTRASNQIDAGSGTVASAASGIPESTPTPYSICHSRKSRRRHRHRCPRRHQSSSAPWHSIAASQSAKSSSSVSQSLSKSASKAQILITLLPSK